MTSAPCRLCGSDDVQECLRINHVPRNIQRLFKVDQLVQDRAIDLTVHRCESCGFVQIYPVLEDGYYDDYLMTTSHSRQMQEFQRDQALDFITRFDLSGKSIKEMGCGDGNYLAHLKEAGAVVSGVEPSEKFRALAVERGFEVESGYVSCGRTLKGAPFDGFVTRQVLEHVPDIRDFLLGVRENLKPGAHGLVEVPSLEKALADRRFYDFFPDHVNYFSQRTLRMALEMSGFEVLETRHGMFDEYNIAIVRNPDAVPFDAVQETVRVLADEINSFIAENKQRGGKVAIWGAGGKGLSILAAANVANVDMLVDGDPHKHGLYTPVSHLRVESPEALRNTKVDAVIVTAMAYRHEITSLLENKYAFSGVIAFLGHHLEILQMEARS